MENIKRQNFEIAKNKIQTLAQNVPSKVSIESFPTEGTIIPWHNHNITGDEANRLLVLPLQSTLIAQNDNIRSLFNIADEVYKALESLDKEYIAGIITSIESAKVASDQAKTASAKAERASIQALNASQDALRASKKADNAQADIKKTIEGLTETVQILKEFKKMVTGKLDSIEKFNRTTERICNDIAALQQYHSKLESFKHLVDVDAIWNDVENQKTNLAGFHQQVDAFIESVSRTTERIHGEIAALQQYRSMLESFQHLGDVDVIWKDVESQKTDLANYRQQVDDLHRAHSKLEEVNMASHIIYEKRIKTAYYVGGTALGLSIINYILQILGVF